MGTGANKNFANFKPEGKTDVVMLQEWTQFQNTLNQKLNLLFSLSGIDYNVVALKNLPTNLTGPAWAYTTSDGNFWAWNVKTSVWQKVSFVLS